MHNSFITSGFDWMVGGSTRLRLANELLGKIGSRVRLRAPTSTGYMSSIEMRGNLYHLVSQILAYDVPGEIVEFGSFAGESAVLMATVVKGESAGRVMHVYDTFSPAWHERDPRGRLLQRFQERDLPAPIVHQGYFEETIPAQLPERLAFVNIDCGYGGDPMKHAETMVHLLTHAYPRMARGAICALVDYVAPNVDHYATTENPGVQIGCDRFMADKPEKISVMHAGEYGHAYFRKL